MVYHKDTEPLYHSFMCSLGRSSKCKYCIVLYCIVFIKNSLVQQSLNDASLSNPGKKVNFYTKRVSQKCPIVSKNNYAAGRNASV